MPLALSLIFLSLTLSLQIPAKSGMSARDLATALETAPSETEQNRLLENHKDLIARSLVEALTELSDARTTNNDYASGMKLCLLAIRVGESIGDHVGVGNALCELGRVHNRQGRNAEAREAYKKCLSIADATGEKKMKLRALNGTGISHTQDRRYDLAAGYYEQGLKICEEIGDRKTAAHILNNLGNAYAETGRDELGLETLRKSLVLSQEIGDKVTQEQALNNIATMYIDVGRYAEALEYLQKSLKMIEEIGTGRDPQGLAIKLQNIGLVYRRQGRPDQALVYYEKSLRLMEELGDKFGIANLQNNIGVAWKSTPDYERALEWIQKALSGYEAIKAKGGVARCENNIGDTYRLLGRHQLALEHLQKSLQLREETRDRTGVSLTLINLGRLYKAQGRSEETLTVSKRAEKIAEDANDPEVLWNAQELIGIAQQSLGQPAEARRYFLASIDTVERLRREVAGGQQQQTYLENRLGPWLGMVNLLISQKNYSEALAFAERSKARVLLDTLQGGRAHLRESLSTEEHQTEKTQRLKLVALNSQLTSELRRDKSDTTRVAALRSDIEKARLEYEALETGLFAAHPELRFRRGEASIITTDEMGRLLKDTTSALIEYVVGEDHTYLFVITRSQSAGELQVRAYTIPVRKEVLARQTETFRVQLANRDLGFSATGHKLYDLLVRPAQAQLNGKTNLVIVPDEKIWELPFQALLTENGQYLIEKSSVSYAPSLTVLGEMSRHRSRNTPGPDSTKSAYSLLAFGNPDIGKETIDKALMTVSDEKLAPLPQAEKEARALGQLYGASRSKVYIGADAREDRFKAEASQARVLHFATHGILNNTSPMYSHLALSQGSAEEDGLLEAWELMQMDLHADLAVLSACETARGRFGPGEGMIGLTWALFMAGVPSTLVSQWKVDSASTRELMVNFHQLSRSSDPSTRGIAKAEALRRAALKVMKNPTTRHPFYWAGFVLVGDGS